MKKSFAAVLLPLSILLTPCISVFAQKKKPISTKPTVVVTQSETQNGQKPLTNTDVIRMVKGGFGENIILNAIQTNESQFDVSMNALFALKNAGVSQKIIEAMQFAVAKKSQTQNQTSTVSVQKTVTQTSETAPALSEEHLKNLPQPYILSVSQNRRIALPKTFATLIQTKAKGSNIAAILVEDEIRGMVIGKALETVAGGMVNNPSIFGRIPVGAILKLPGIRREPVYTFIYALEGRQSKKVYALNSPKFELFFGDIVGANPDDFEPVILKVSPTPNNWRLVYADKAKEKVYLSIDKVEYNIIEERVATTVNKLGRGHTMIEPQQPLTDGEYAVVMRPISKLYKVSRKDVLSNRGEGVVLGSIWDFSISNSPSTTQSINSTSQQNSQTSLSATTNTNSTSTTTNTNSVSDTQNLPIYGSVADIKNFTRIYVYAEDAESRERIIKAFKDAPQFQIVGNPQEAQITLEYKVLSRDSNTDRGNKDIRVKSQLSAIYINSGKRAVAWSDTAEHARLTSGGIGFRTQHNESKLTERFIKAMKN